VDEADYLFGVFQLFFLYAEFVLYGNAKPCHAVCDGGDIVCTAEE
jgi:hypothetical protein